MVKGSSLGSNPTVDWFFNDWHGGTSTLSRFQKGCYMDLLHAQFNNGHLSLEEIKNVLGNDFAAWGVLSKKFKKDSEEKFFNERLELEIIKKKNYSKSRSENRKSQDHMSPHMGNGLGNELEKRKKEWSEKVCSEFSDKYSMQLLKDFCDYWTEHSPNGKKMRFEKETVFDVSRRLNTWSTNAETFAPKKKEIAEFPDHYDSKLIQKMDGKQISRYYQHLHSLGLEPVKDRFGETIDFKLKQIA